MGKIGRREKRFAHFFGGKSSKAVIVAALGASFLLLSCRTLHSPTGGAGNIATPLGFPRMETKVLTKNGFNKRPRIGPNGKRLLLVSSHRDKHKQFQAYLYDLESQQERRLTYQDGDVYDVHFDRKGTALFYASTTDEIKEDSDYIRRALNPEAATAEADAKENLKEGDLLEILPRTEIYQSSLNGYQITRLTQHPGFDGMITVHPTQDILAFTRWQQKGPVVMQMNLQGKSKQITRLISGGYLPEYSPDGKQLAWLTKEKETFHIKVGDTNGRNGKSVHFSESNIIDFSWSPDSQEILFSKSLEKEAGTAASENVEIFRINLKTQCLQRLTYHAAKDLSPQLSKDQKTLYFESDRLEVNQIFSMDLTKLPACAEEPRKLE